MKRLLGCLLIFGIFGLAAAVAGYLYVLKPMTALATDFQAAVTSIRTVGELESGVENTDPFDPPADGVLSAEQVEQFVAVQTTIAGAASSGRAALQERYDALIAFGEDAEDGARSPRAFVDAVGAFADALRATKQAQVQALNDQALSVAEYQWVQKAALAALGVNALPADLTALHNLDLRRFREAKDLGGGVEETDAAKVPQANVVLVEPYRDTLQSWITAAVFGL